MRSQLEIEPPERSDCLPHTSSDWAPEDLTVQLEPAFSIRGVVRDRQGRAVSEGTVYVSRTASVDSVSIARDGTFVVRGLAADEMVDLRAGRGSSPWRDAPMVRVRAATHDVVLTFTPASDLRVHLQGWTPPEGEARAAALHDPASPEDVALLRPISDDGRIHFEGLEDGVHYVLWIPPDREGRSLWRPDVRAQEEPLEVTPAPGRSIRVLLTTPADAKVGRVWAYLVPGVGVQGARQQDGTYVIAGLPPGRWTVRANATKGEDEILHAGQEAEAGATVELTLEPR